MVALEDNKVFDSSMLEGYGDTHASRSTTHNDDIVDKLRFHRFHPGRCSTTMLIRQTGSTQSCVGLGASP